MDQNEIFLFNEGRLLEAYRSLGAHVTDGGVTFRVWAPGARNVYVTGDFNGWGKSLPLMPVESSGIWEGTVPEAAEGSLYKYLIEPGDGRTLEKADPYAFMAEMRPSTASIVHTLVSSWTDDRWMEGRNRKDHLKEPMNIYEVHAGSWKRKPLSDPANASEWEKTSNFLTYTELADELIPYVKEMGYTHIELMPVMEHPLDASWGYQVTGYFAATSRFGEPEGLKYLINKAHRNNIGVILDWVPGHFCRDAHGLSEFNGKFLYEKDLHPNWGTAKFDFGRPEVRTFLLSNAHFWLEEYHADGIRVDGVSSMLYLNFGVENKKDYKFNRFGTEENLEATAFLRELSRMAGERHPGAVLIAEESTAWPLVTYPPKDGGLGFHYKWDMGWMHDTLDYFSTDFDYRPANHGKLTFSQMYHYSENFVLAFSHDEVVHGKCSLIGKMPGDYWRKFAGLRTMMFYQMTYPGAKLNFMGNEWAPFIEWREYEELEWFLPEQYESHRKHRELIKALNHLYRADKALYDNDFAPEGFSWIDPDNSTQKVLSYERISASRRQRDYAVLNLGIDPFGRFRIGVDKPGNYVILLNTDDEAYGGSGYVKERSSAAEKIPYHGRSYSIEISLPPLGAVLVRRTHA